MNTSNHRQSYSLYPQKTDAQIQAEFADLVGRACKGDRRAGLSSSQRTRVRDHGVPGDSEPEGGLRERGGRIDR